VLVGSAMALADGRFAPLPALAALVGALLLQIGSNFANDYFDGIKGVDTAARVGPVRVTATGLISHAAMRVGMLVVFGCAAPVGFYLVWVGGWPILAVGVASILAALAYTGGPMPFGYRGLGDIFVFLFFGPIALCGTYYVQAQSITLAALLASIALGALITAILVVNNLRDLDNDRRVGKYTLAVRLGATGTRREYALLLLLAFLMPFILAYLYRSGWLCLPLLTLPLAWQLSRTIEEASDGPTLNRALAGTARLTLLFALALAGGLLLR
jgi:1,4-dihydroxy-2-naphthoate octaprenyltransferase